MHWLLFNVVIFFLLAADLLLQYRGPKLKFKYALYHTAFWVALALSFNVILYFTRGFEDALAFFTAYLIEYSLSVDNLFVFILIFQAFNIAPEQAHRVLFWGILGAIVMRAVMILVGIQLVTIFHPILYLFGAILILASIKMAFTKKKEYDPDKNLVVRLSKKFGLNQFMLVLIAVETTDLIFAVDSIPAVFAITVDPFLAYTSNILAVLGLRSLYFVLAGVMGLFRYLHYGLALILFFVGLKMIVQPATPIWISLIVIASILCLSILASLLHPKRQY